jgi:hypothetical protein
MDEYSKSGPKTPRAANRSREQDLLRRMERLLETKTEGEFIKELLAQLGVDPNHPKYLTMIKIWRERHP